MESVAQQVGYKEWCEAVPLCIRNDPLWTVTVYRYALFCADIGWNDICKLALDRRTRSLSDQLYRSLGGISTTVAEGYSRGTGRDRARFYEYELGSAREARDWYFKSRFVLGNPVVDHRMKLLTEVTRLLLTMVPDQRSSSVRETKAEYVVDSGPKDVLEDIPSA